MTGFFTQISTDLLTQVEQVITDWSSYPLAVETPNGDKVDQRTQTNPYLHVMINDLTGDQLELGESGIVRQRGQLIIFAVVKCGAGWRTSTTLLDFIEPYFSKKRLGIVQVEAAQAQKMREIDGWAWFPLLFNYWAIN